MCITVGKNTYADVGILLSARTTAALWRNSPSSGRIHFPFWGRPILLSNNLPNGNDTFLLWTYLYWAKRTFIRRELAFLCRNFSFCLGAHLSLLGTRLPLKKMRLPVRKCILLDVRKFTFPGRIHIPVGSTHLAMCNVIFLSGEDHLSAKEPNCLWWNTHSYW